MPNLVTILPASRPVEERAWLVHVNVDVPEWGWHESDILSVIAADLVDCDAKYQLVTGAIAQVQFWERKTFRVVSPSGDVLVLPHDEVNQMVVGRVTRRWQQVS
ncbi:MAG: hypothetical protein INF52_08975 [Rhodobacter sp.]|nr:hypothetical protein [Rhodobacter sp.]